MKYKLFDEYITLQSLLKELGIIQSGGAIKSYLAENTVLFNGEDEKRRGKKIRIGDEIFLTKNQTTIYIVEPTQEEKHVHLEDIKEKERVTKLVKKLNQENKNNRSSKKTKTKNSKKPVRFPGI